jgi:5-formyltetrahydrofolate cyclo-ligase
MPSTSSLLSVGKTWMSGKRPGMTTEMAIPADNQNQKAQLRAEALVRRDALPAAVRAAGAEAIASRPFPIKFEQGAIISGFSPMKSEINPVPLMRKLADAGAKLALPAIVGRGKPLIMRAWSFGEPLASGQWGIREPVPELPEVSPDILIVPLAAFDRVGHRIGYGAGYFDMTINALRAKKKIIAIGIAFAAQEIPQVPATERDARLDLVLTERETIDFRSA